VPMAIDNLRWHLLVKGGYRGTEFVEGEIGPTIQHLRQWDAEVLRYAEAGAPRMVVPEWFIDDVAHAGPEHLDPAYVRGYDRKSQVDPAADIELLVGHGLDGRSTVVDFGAGTETFARAVAARCRQVIALEPSGAMVEAAREAAVAQGTANVVIVQAGLLSYEHAGERVDFAYTRNVLHHLPDFWKAIALQRIGDIVRPGGVLLLRDIVYSCEPEEASNVIEAWVAAGAIKPDEGWTPGELATHVREEHSTFSWLLEPMIERAGFAVEMVEHSPSRVFFMYVCRRR
jgi:SAM-dependent methyltransferase